jgi:hypothetical protein
VGEIKIPRFCVLCAQPATGAYHLPPGRGWTVERILILCARCAEDEGAYCVHVDGREDYVPASPFVAAEDFSSLVGTVCWCIRAPLVPWCPTHGPRSRDMDEVRAGHVEDEQERQRRCGPCPRRNHDQS